MNSNLRWKISDLSDEKKARSLDISKLYGLSEIVTDIIVDRYDFTDKEVEKFLYGTVKDLFDPYLLKDMDKAVSRIITAINNKEKIAVFGDYDVDGLSASALLWMSFSQIGLNIDCYIPHRINEGYGLSENFVQKAIIDKIDLIITVDNGISAFNPIELAMRNNIDVIVTDHHEVSDALPGAFAVIDPKRKDCFYPNKHLSGSAVAFKLVQALFEKLSVNNSHKYLDMASLGTLSDSMELTIENRIIVKHGLDLINKGSNKGLSFLAAEAKYEKKPIDPYAVLFILGPRLNSAGRMDDPALAFRLLIEKDMAVLKKTAYELNVLNLKRQETESAIRSSIDELIKATEKDKTAIVLWNEEWHLGVLGIVAAKISEDQKKPVILASEVSGKLKGSARCPEDQNIFEALKNTSYLLLNYGGHRSAAGFSLLKENFDDFKRNILTSFKYISDKIKEIRIDRMLEPEIIDIKLINELKLLEPFGQGNPEPVFAINRADILEKRLVGNPPVHFQFKAYKNGYYFSSIAFKKEHYLEQVNSENFYYDIAFTLGIDDFFQEPRINLYIKDINLHQKECDLLLNYPQDSFKLGSSKDAVPQVIDARLIKKELDFLTKIINHSERYIIFVKDNEKYWKIKSLNCGENNIIHSEYEWKDVSDKIGKEHKDIVLFDPPTDIDKFVYFLSARRIYLLFSCDDVIKLENKILSRFPDRNLLVIIYKKLLMIIKDKELIEVSDLVSSVNSFLVDSETVLKALKIFSEIDILEYYFTDENRIFVKIKNEEKTDLNRSETYRKNNEILKKFYTAKKIITHPDVRIIDEFIKKARLK